MQIDTDIPIPTDRGRVVRKRHIAHNLEVGHSYFVQIDPEDAATTYEAVRNGASAVGKRVGKKFLAQRRTEAGVQGTRVWRTE